VVELVEQDLHSQQQGLLQAVGVVAVQVLAARPHKPADLVNFHGCLHFLVWQQAPAQTQYLEKVEEAEAARI
jgi:hypothetical protein